MGSAAGKGLAAASTGVGGGVPLLRSEEWSDCQLGAEQHSEGKAGGRGRRLECYNVPEFAPNPQAA